jgi:hypothetical protein
VVLCPQCPGSRITGPTRKAIVDGCEGPMAQAAFMFEAPFCLVAQWQRNAPDAVSQRPDNA